VVLCPEVWFLPTRPDQHGTAKRVLRGGWGELRAQLRLEALYVLAVTTRLRRGELQGLTWEDVDLDAGTILGKAHALRAPWRVIFEALKSGKGRQIRLTQRATVALKEDRKRQLEERMERRALAGSRPCVPLRRREASSGRQPEPRFQGSATARRTTGDTLPRPPAHMRHALAPARRQLEVRPQKLLGHADMSLSLNVYSHVLPDMGDAAAGAMDAAIGE
jgi:integrase